MKNPLLQVAKARSADNLAFCLIAGSWLSAITIGMLINRLAAVLLSR